MSKYLFEILAPSCFFSVVQSIRVKRIYLIYVMEHLPDSEGWKKVKSITDEAKAKGILKSMDTIVETVTEGNIEVLIRLMI